MSSELSVTNLIVIAEIAVSVIILLYAGYTAFTIRRGLVIPLYRSRALWLGTSAILWSVFLIFFDNTVTKIGSPSGLFGMYHIIAGLVFYAGVVLPTLIVFLALIDRTNGTLIRLDYRRKDILGWKKVRLFYWVGVAFFAVGFLIDLGPSPGYGYYQSSIPRSVISFTHSYAIILLFFILAYAASVLIVGSFRARDQTFRNYAKWLGLAIATFVLAFVSSVISIFISYLVIMMFAYCWYRMARSLVPVNKLSPNASMENKRSLE